MYENDFFMTDAKEIEYVRSPFYDLARKERMNKEKANDLIETLEMKLSLTSSVGDFLKNPKPNAEAIAYTRYADNLAADEKAKKMFEFPRGKPYTLFNAAELYRIQKTPQHWDDVRQSKSFIAPHFFPPFDLKDGNLKSLLID